MTHSSGAVTTPLSPSTKRSIDESSLADVLESHRHYRIISLWWLNSKIVACWLVFRFIRAGIAASGSCSRQSILSFFSLSGYFNCQQLTHVHCTTEAMRICGCKASWIETPLLSESVQGWKRPAQGAKAHGKPSQSQGSQISDTSQRSPWDLQILPSRFFQYLPFKLPRANVEYAATRV